MIQRILVVLILMLPGISLRAQSKYGYQVGLDTTAARHKIKSKTTFVISYDGASIDTSQRLMLYYNEDGYIVRQYENQWRDIRFTYNAEGYLTGETSWLDIRGPVANGSG